MLERQEFIEKFKEEALERLQRLNEGYIQLESGFTDKKILEDLLREAHTLKGSARMVGLSSISDLAHKLEDIFLYIKEGKAEPSGEVSEVVFQILDTMLELAEKGEDDFTIAESIVDKVNILLSGDKISHFETSSNQENSPNKNEYNQVGQEEEQIKVHEMTTIRVKSSQIDDVLNLVGESVIVANQLVSKTGEIKQIIQKQKLINELWHQLREAIDFFKLNKYQMEQVRSVHALILELKAKTGILQNIVDSFSKLDLLLSELHQKSIELRMLPASYIFNLFPRAVRDMAKEFSKKIDLTIEGEDTLIDKRVLEEVYDPLIHILRNAVDHGIEMPEERLAYGKPETGKIVISAKQEGDRIIIKVSDDGRGIDPELIKRIALKKGLITEAEANSISEKEAIYLIFKPGFSSKAETTETSGRGIGMDVVKLHVEEKLKGHIEIETKKGEGTTFILTLPLTLAIVRCLLLKTAGMLFAFPTSSVQETVIFNEEDIVIVGGERQLKIRNTYVPFIKLSNALGLKGIYEGNLAVVVNLAGRVVAYEVEEIIDEIPVVIKPIDEIINSSKLYAGATILGSGDIVLIINVAELVRTTTSTFQTYPYKSIKKLKTGRQKARILVVDDSLTTREIEVSMLRAAGFEADGVRDGYEALMALQSKHYDLVLTDIQMPRMDGYELIKKIKKDERLRKIPTIVVSSKSSQKDIELGLKAGADAYITKNDFETESLLTIISRFININ